MNRTAELGQYPTPVWVAEALVERYFAGLGAGDAVLEPSCGAGSFLGVIPPEVPALGVEIDPVLAEQARRNTGRRVITGDFTRAEIDFRPTAVIGNPPFRTQLIDAFLERSHALLPEGGRVGFILPVYTFQTASRVARYASRWGMEQTLIPRNIYRGLQCPLCFAIFSKDRRRTLVGFALYRETVASHGLEARYREAMEGTGRGSLWARVIDVALDELNGEGALADIYRVVEGRRPTDNPFWREQIRKVARTHFPRVGRGRYARRSQETLPLVA
ncbi:site-specific DNA-methyltransferase (adenine-specific) [Natronocella acetinitrilica]|uniref:Site-specific DNA-methyltransferase (Adenine-specific) n=1 Tax=Natronocella acetinitrilica TaxID=414046 RepID=A0AAE3G286_9GAMM|nr:hypothetical protein [Natronocella acetinitrilica]MCP1674431.1 site-specific DNA-methyltransferase (adenine-specific) [Natronocella acetinitrilica]